MALYQYPLLTPLQTIKDGLYKAMTTAVVGQTYTIVCPRCGQENNFTAEKEGAAVVRCSKCKAAFGYNAGEKKTETVPSQTKVIHLGRTQNSVGKLEWRRLMMTRSASLHIGTNIIGRKDDEYPSEISFDDAYMSRQSIAIDVQPNIKGVGYTFKLTVQKAANPILVGGSQLMVGNSIYLNYGDTIKLGNTTLTFKENTKS